MILRMIIETMMIIIADYIFYFPFLITFHFN